jgi:beta-hydroxylase
MPGADKPKGLRRNLTKKLGKKLFRGVFLEYLARQSLVPNAPVLDARLFPWAEEFRASWREIRAELEEQLRHRAALPNFQDISPDQYRISPDSMWKTFVFWGFGERSELNCELCPKTAAALSRVPRLETAFFSVLAPGKHVPRHRGVTKGMVRCHLALKVPKGEERCAMDVGGVHCTWREGELLFFDDTYPHEVWNDTSEERAVLLFDFERPMRRPGQILSRLMLRVLRRTAYFRDAQRNQRAWEERYREVLARRAA